MTTAIDHYVDNVTTTPAPGSILRTFDDSYSTLRVVIDDGRPPFVYGRAYPSENVDDSLGWYLRSAVDERNAGYKCILMSAARKQLARLFPEEFKSGVIPVKSLRVIRKSESGRGLLCEVHRYAVDDVKLREVFPPDAEFDEKTGLFYLQNNKWTITKPTTDAEYGRVCFNCVDPNGLKVNIIL